MELFDWDKSTQDEEKEGIIEFKFGNWFHYARIYFACGLSPELFGLPAIYSLRKLSFAYGQPK